MEKMKELDNSYVISTVTKFITKSKDNIESDGQIKEFIPDAPLNNALANTNYGRETRKLFLQ